MVGLLRRGEAVIFEASSEARVRYHSLPVELCDNHIQRFTVTQGYRRCGDAPAKSRKQAEGQTWLSVPPTAVQAGLLGRDVGVAATHNVNARAREHNRWQLCGNHVQQRSSEMPSAEVTSLAREDFKDP